MKRKKRKISDSRELRICLFVNAVPRMCHQHRPLRAEGLGLRPADVRGGDYSRFYQQQPEDLTQRIFKMINQHQINHLDKKER